MNSITRNGLLIAAVPTTALVAALLIPSPAAAASDALALTGTCTGTLVGTYPVGDTAQMEIWYSPVAGGTNCVKTVSTSGKNNARYLRVWAAAIGTNQANSDEGHYRHYAGPLTLTGTSGTCISVTAKASPDRQVAGAASHSITNKHCG